MTKRPDDDARLRILTEFGTTLFVEAAAGTGKTTALVGRIVALVREGVSTLDCIVAVTFTEKAAGEMKLRLRSEIERARKGATVVEHRQRLEQALAELELARIGTIHAFCGDLLRERPVEAAIDPLFEVAAEGETQALIDQAFDAWFPATLADPPEGVRRILRRRLKGQSPREALRGALASLVEHRDFPTPWRRAPFGRAGAIDALLQRLADVGAVAAKSSWPADYLARSLTSINQFVLENARAEEVRDRDYDGLEASLRSFARDWSWTYRGAQGTRFGPLSREEVLARRDKAKADLDELISATDADLAPLLQANLQSAVTAYEQLKSQRGSLDFLDLLVKTRDLIRDDATVRAKLQRRYTHFFVDEFQDTDPLQAEILLLLAADDPREVDWRAVQPVSGKLFLVGDPKQSVYRFRRADVAVYEQVKEKLLATGAELLHLSTSFRGLRSLQTFVNAAFGPAMGESADGSQARYVPLDYCRSDVKDRPIIVALPVPRPYGEYGKIVKYRIEESLPIAVGGFIDWLVHESGWTVEEEGGPVAIRPRHICILFRRFRNFSADVTRPYVRSLEARRIPHVVVGGRSFHDREEIIALRNALSAIEWPDNELRVFATLRGPFFAIGDDALLAYRQYLDEAGMLQTRHLNPLRAVEKDQLDPIACEVADALALLARLQSGRNHRPIAQTITMLLDAVRAHAGVALWATGEQALANCMRLVEMARRFERSAFSFRAFVEKIENEAERGEADEAPIMEEGTEGVRMMTVHKAKGLEFPVVVLADPTCKATRDTPSRHVDPDRRLWLEPLCGCAPIELLEAAAEEQRRDRAEAVRVAYVAATRARDLLVVPVGGDAPIDGWLQVLDTVLYPPDSARDASTVAPGCPTFGDDSVLDRGPKGVPPAGGPVRPGLHQPSAGGPPIAWWDPGILRLEVEEQVALRQQRILEADSEGTAATESIEDYTRWKQTRHETLAQASQPSVSVQTVTALARTYVTDENIQTVYASEANPSRAGGRRFGTLVHSVFATINLDAGPDSVRAAVVANGRQVAATVDEIADATIAVAAALNHPILRLAAAAACRGDLRRETPILLKREDSSLVEGVIDMAFRQQAPDFTGWTVVDFKTDREFEVSVATYTSQVALYMEAIKTATNLPARGILLVV